MASAFVNVVSGQTLSNVVTLDPANRSLVIAVPSYNVATAFRFEFSTAIDAASVTFGPVGRTDGSGQLAYVASVNPAGPLWGIMLKPPTPFVRLNVSPAATVPLSCTVYPGNP